MDTDRPFDKLRMLSLGGQQTLDAFSLIIALAEALSLC
jgi:hypothetical protein